MGNSASNANNPPRNTTSTMRNTSISPSPGNPHPSMRTKKRSLELPDLASLSLTPTSALNAAHRDRGRQAQAHAHAQQQQQQHAKSASIPIPAAPQTANPFNHYLQAQEIDPEDGEGERRTTVLPSTSDMLEQAAYHQQPSTHQPFPPPARGREGRGGERGQNTGAPKGRQQPISARQQQQVMRIQELYDRSQQQHPAAPPSSPAGSSVLSGYSREVVRSSIPIVLGKAAKEAAEKKQKEVEGEVMSPLKEDLLADPVPVKIVWRGGGKEVVLARAGDDEWKGRQPMERDPVNANVWTLSVSLQPGTHHVRFLVDGQWRVADDLPAAVDDQGSLANYVAVPLTYGLPGQTQPAQTNTLQIPPPPAAFNAASRKLPPGQSFWSADSSADGEDSSDVAHRPSTSSASTNKATQAAAAASAAAAAYITASWTSVFPPELLEAAREEEAYLSASAGQYDGPSGNTRVTGFVPAPNIPPAPSLPRHLEKLILNSKVGEQKTGSGSGSVRGEGSASGGAGHAGGVGSSGVGSGQGSAARRERRERERSERERERGTRSTRRGNVPPPPPPSEDGTGEYEPPSIPIPPPPPPPIQEERTANPLASTSAGTLSAGSGGVESAGTTTAATSPQGSLPATPTGQLSPVQTPPKMVWASGTGVVPASALLGSSTIPSTSQPSSQAPSQPSSHPPSQSHSQSHTPATTTPSTYPQPPPLERAAISGSRAITIDDANMPSLTDDNSVLPVPSHAVLHHLCTSAIRNGVLAVANTTRYRKKYLTTIYYKPT